jgi:hypothetical protein
MRSSSRGILAPVIAGIIIAGSLAMPAARGQTASPYGTELVINGGAEADGGATSNSQVVKPSGWTTTGEFTAVKYGASGGFPNAESPGPGTRGKNLFEGGNVARSTASQSIALKAPKADIASGSVRYTFSAWLGGFSGQADNAVVSVSFRDSAGEDLGGTTLGPVTPAQRKDITGSLERTHSGVVPKGAETAVVAIVLTRFDGTYNDGSADNVSLTLTKK